MLSTSLRISKKAQFFVKLTSLAAALETGRLASGRGEAFGALPTDRFKVFSFTGVVPDFSTADTERRVEVSGLVGDLADRVDVPLSFGLAAAVEARVVGLAGALKK